MEKNVVAALLCPRCGLEYIPPTSQDAALRCTSGHSFDIAKQGYVNLITGAGTKFVQDSSEMVAARDAFLEAGHYGPLATMLANEVQQAMGLPVVSRHGNTPLLLDAGTGTGWYLQQIMGSFATDSPMAIGLDISKFALRRAARRNPMAANLVWDIWQPLPVKTGRVDALLVVFAPRNPKEFMRVIRPGGLLFVVTPGEGHLQEIGQQTGMLSIQANKEQALEDSFAEYFENYRTFHLSVPLVLTRTDVVNVAVMGPAGHHVDLAELRSRVTELDEETAVTAHFRVSIFRAKN